MSLISSISGIRGTIGGGIDSGLNPINISEFTSAFAAYIKKSSPIGAGKVVVGRDARMSGDIVKGIVISSLRAMGLDVIDLDYATTPTTEMAVTHEGADGGIIITASHNPKQWNALKLLNHKGEFLDAKAGEEILSISQSKEFEYASVDKLGQYIKKDFAQEHIDAILSLPEIDVQAIKNSNISVVVDCINSVGSVIVPKLLEALGVNKINLIHGDLSGDFAHNPEPLPEHLEDLSNAVVNNRANVGFSVDPDVDRLAIVCEDGSMFGEENTLVCIADYLLEQHPGATTVSNLSSSRALRDVTQAHGGRYFAAPVGEVNVVQKMKEENALIGGEGNGGIILPALHYGRDALVGIALYLTIMAQKRLAPTQLLARLPKYAMAKKKVELSPSLDIDKILLTMQDIYAGNEITTIDGVKIDFPDKWVHLRRSNTEPIIRVYSEAPTSNEAEEIAEEIIQRIKAESVTNK
ncbi:phosphoglucosamine mutase [Porphyromonas sp.]|uniref:phosphoglucosamine mutase n=1 Tax=Porphyromonas sp. TaxID=1924944 RepID=UPI0026DDBEDF|nr:phosphoglucosamine mutase [Porphyromonas sp.]MDO4695240.1 phosphoglucosamine mutase [Porphyromonas sp.]MDO4771071.1 phosphoglucosamine mutase [Porphyromonas sp.]